MSQTLFVPIEANPEANPLCAVNREYDQLAERLGFKRQPGTRDVLRFTATAMLERDIERAKARAEQLTGQQRMALTAATLINREVLQEIQRACRDDTVRGVVVAGVTFDFWETV